MSSPKRGYANSFIYSKYPDYEKNILDFIMSSERVEKDTDRFMHVSDEVKYRQITAVLHRTLMNENVVLCTHRKGMPAAFKVFAARDVKIDRSPKIFIDVTDIITLEDGFYKCKKIDILCAYLMAAMQMLVYDQEPEKLLNNSVLITTSTSCFQALVSFVFDYLRVNGYSENKIKIGYIVAMYYQITLLGKDRDRSAMNIAIKVAGGATKDITTYEFYYDLEHLENIDTLINHLANTFKLKGLTTDVFLEKWLWLLGKGTQFGLEVYPAFSKILTDAFSGSYTNNHNSIEKRCGRDMVTYTNTLLRICGEVIDRGMRYESACEREQIYAAKQAKVLQEALFADKKAKEARKDFDNALASSNQTAQINAVKKLIEAIEETNGNQKDYDKHLRIIFGALNADTDDYILGKKSSYKPVFTPFCKLAKKHISDKLKGQIVGVLGKVITYMPEQLKEKNPTFIAHEKESRAVLKDCQDAHKFMTS